MVPVGRHHADAGYTNWQENEPKDDETGYRQNQDANQGRAWMAADCRNAKPSTQGAFA
jgi:hypothetical protein